MTDVVNEIDDELADNPTKRVPVCLCLDVSGSMSGSSITQLNEGVKLFYEAVNDDIVAKQSADVCVVTFDDRASKVQDFQNITDEIAPHFSAGGSTAMGEAVNLAMDLLEERKKEYQDSGTEYFQPWLVIIADGAPTDEYINAAKRVSDIVNNKKLVSIVVAVDGANKDVLSQFTPKYPVIEIKSVNFKEFFQWLSQSVVATSRSTDAGGVTLPPLTLPD